MTPRRPWNRLRKLHGVPWTPTHHLQQTMQPTRRRKAESVPATSGLQVLCSGDAMGRKTRHEDTPHDYPCTQRGQWIPTRPCPFQQCYPSMQAPWKSRQHCTGLRQREALVVAQFSQPQAGVGHGRFPCSPPALEKGAYRHPLRHSDVPYDDNSQTDPAADGKSVNPLEAVVSEGKWHRGHAGSDLCGA
jgi:hypothetical protein